MCIRDSHKAENLEMLVTAVHHLARLGREQRVEIVITALDEMCIRDSQ